MNGFDRHSRRVLHVLGDYAPTDSEHAGFLEGCSAVMQEIAPDVGHDLLVVETPRPIGDTPRCTTLGRIAWLSDRRLGPWRRQAAMAAWFLRHLHRYDTVHVHGHLDRSFLSYLMARLAGRRLLLSATLEDSLPVLIEHYSPRLRPWAQRGFRLFDGFVSVNPRLDAETRCIAEASRCHLIPRGISLPDGRTQGGVALRQSLRIGATAPVLLFVGGLCMRQDPLFLVRALPRILDSHPGTILVLVGPELEPGYQARVRQAMAELGVAENVRLVGAAREPHRYFAIADLLVTASRLEGFALAVPEAMAHGLPVLARNLPGVNDSIVRDAETGFRFDTEDGYVAAATRLLGDAAQRGRLGTTARRMARARFGMRGVAARYLAVYGVATEPAAPEETRLGHDAAVFDGRFHAPLAARPLAAQPRQAAEPPARNAQPPLLISMVDAEEAFDWSGPFQRDAPDVGSMAAQALAHRVFERHGVVPLYLVDYPVATQDAGRAPLRELLRSGACEFGAQMHPWVTPPFTETLSEHNSYAGNLPVALELAKARCLTDTLAEAFGEVPRIFRTGRFGAGPRTADILKSLGYLADSSVTPFWPPRSDAGGAARDWAFSAQPYWADLDRTLLEIPVSAALVGRLAGPRSARLAPHLFGPMGDRLRLGGALARAGLLERIRLSPEGTTIVEAKRLVRHMLADGHRSFVLTYHSPSLVPGNTPYVRDAAELDRFLGWLDEFYAFFREEAGGCFGSWRDLRGLAPRPVTASLAMAAA